MKTVVGMFNTASEAQRTIDELVQLGFGPKDISVVTSLSGQRSIGGKLSLAPLDVSDLGKIAACGPIADSLRQSNANGLTATLQYYGLSPKLAEHYALGVQHGETLETLTVDDKDADRVVAVMEKHARLEREASEKRATTSPGVGAAAAAGMGAVGAAGSKAFAGVKETFTGAKEKIKDAAASMANTAPASTNGGLAQAKGHVFGTDEERRIPIMREELRVGKREVERGGVHVSVHVKETPISERISLREEHVEIERHLVDRAPRADETFFKGEELNFEEYAEEPVVSKEVRVVEEVVVHKRVSGHDEVVSDTLRATEVDIDLLRGFDRGDFRKHFDSLNLGGNFDEYIPAYEFGYKMRGSGGNRWEDIEISTRDKWEASRPGTWQRFKDAIRYAWSRARGQ